VLRAAARLAEATGCRRGMEIRLEKRIPPGSGLGGGSSNAATTLQLLNELWELGLSKSQLAGIGAELGSDVPLFLNGPLSIIRGRGEMVMPVERTLDAWVLLVLPAIACATPRVYRAFDDLPDPLTGTELADVLAVGSAGAMMPLLFNDLEAAALDAFPEMASLAMCLRDIVGEHVRMTGSGSAWFHLYDTEAEARKAAEAVRGELALGVEVTRLAL
jgi:4-diphosphocytidyl-2-C-methyl-D-erythritol kinase